jgi:hypothetical protein
MSIAPRLTVNSDGLLDLKMTAGKFEWAEDGTQSAQHGALRLQIFKGEWVYNSNLGVDWYGIIFNQQKSITEKEFEFKRAILGTPGVLQITRFTFFQDGQTVTIDGDVQTEWGPEGINVSVTPL